MDFYWIKTNAIIKRLFSRYIWDIPNNKRVVYLTFDDGPTPDITEWTLEQLEKHGAKATFFCIGNNIEKYPEIYAKIIQNGHSIGNHTFNHLNGWKTKDEEYIENVKLCEAEINLHPSSKSELAKQSKIYNLKSKIFRPPYGKIKSSQAKELQELGYKIIMWDVLSADFDNKITPEKCLQNVIRNTTSGSIIVFHDSIKAYGNLEYALPKVLAFLKEKEFVFETLN